MLLLVFRDLVHHFPIASDNKPVPLIPGPLRTMATAESMQYDKRHKLPSRSWRAYIDLRITWLALKAL